MTIFRHTWLTAVTAVSIVLLAAVIVVLICLPQTLIVRDADSGKIYMTAPCPDGTEFLVEFTHSVNLSPVIDTFRAENGEIRAVKAKFYAFGAGMPTELNPGESLSFTAVYDSLNYIVGTVYDYYLTIGGDTVNLRELCGRNAHVEIVLIGKD